MRFSDGGGGRSRSRLRRWGLNVTGKWSLNGDTLTTRHDTATITDHGDSVTHPAGYAKTATIRWITSDKIELTYRLPVKGFPKQVGTWMRHKKPAR
jgi:hypothetical protein